MGRNINIIELVSYVAFVLLAIVLLLVAFGSSWKIIGTLQNIAYICAAIGLSFSAFNFARRYRGTRNGIAWMIIFWIAVVVFVIVLLKLFGLF